MKIVIINGMAQSGKDTVVDIISQYRSVRNISTIDPYRGIPYLLGFKEGDKSEKYRYFLCELKKLTGGINSYHIDYVKTAIDDSSGYDYAFIHSREPLEIQELKEMFNATTLLVTNARTKNIASNTSDMGVYDYEYDYIIRNDSTLEELEITVQEYLKYMEDKR